MPGVLQKVVEAWRTKIKLALEIQQTEFMMTADEWQELDAQSRASLIAVATRRAEPVSPRRFPEGTGKHEIIDFIDSEPEEALELLDDGQQVVRDRRRLRALRVRVDGEDGAQVARGAP